MSLQRGIDGAEPLRPDAAAVPGTQEIRPARVSSLVATGTMACPQCDVPVALARAVTPAEPLACPYCGHAGRVREFLSLAAPSRPARVEVRVAARFRPRSR